MTSFIKLLILICLSTTHVYSQNKEFTEEYEERDFLLECLHSNEESKKIDTISYISSLKPLVVPFKGQTLEKLLDFISLDFKYNYYIFEHTLEFQISKLTLMYHPNAIIEVTFQNPILYDPKNTSIERLFKLKILAVNVVTWKYRERFFNYHYKLKKPKN